MLILEVKTESESFDEETQKFVDPVSFKLRLEHSLVSLSKWESFYEKPFLNNKEKTSEETLTYLRMMCVDDEIPPEVLQHLTQKQLDEINKYIDAKMTATTFTERPGARAAREIITSEIIYYWMVSYQIPFECQHWHLNRLLALIKVCNHKNAPAKKMNKRESMAQQRQLNAQRKARLGTRG